MITEILSEEINKRNKLDNKILDIIYNRCSKKAGMRVFRSQLVFYIGKKLGLMRQTKQYKEYIDKLMLKEGIRSTIESGSECYYGIEWNGLDGSIENWRKTSAALDLPIYDFGRQKWRMP